MHLSPAAFVLALAAAPLVLVAANDHPAQNASSAERDVLVAHVNGDWAITAMIAERRPPLGVATDELISDGHDRRIEGQRRREDEEERKAEETFEDAVQAMRDGGNPN